MRVLAACLGSSPPVLLGRQSTERRRQIVVVLFLVFAVVVVRRPQHSALTVVLLSAEALRSLCSKSTEGGSMRGSSVFFHGSDSAIASNCRLVRMCSHKNPLPLFGSAFGLSLPLNAKDFWGLGGAFV
ncbi:hypothetical protein Y032_0039g85 [Ancylostoma ceylanicum]|uniref:Uncharacterized protein n=1 Tax=Ancylostoma ceylanicum TaxID=53326 RepID=A0A016UHT1_9BILA|nr:hypothetical protein Y032_0039g85 [Ancylostoma ceylanicum]